MASRSRTTLKKRQRELARLEKQREKTVKRMQRKLEKHPPDIDDTESQNAIPEDPGPGVLQDF